VYKYLNIIELLKIFAKIESIRELAEEAIPLLGYFLRFHNINVARFRRLSGLWGAPVPIRVEIVLWLSASAEHC